MKTTINNLEFFYLKDALLKHFNAVSDYFYENNSGYIYFEKFTDDDIIFYTVTYSNENFEQLIKDLLDELDFKKVRSELETKIEKDIETEIYDLLINCHPKKNIEYDFNDEIDETKKSAYIHVYQTNMIDYLYFVIYYNDTFKHYITSDIFFLKQKTDKILDLENEFNFVYL